MARLVLCVLALCAAGAFADPRENWNKLDVEVLKQRQLDLLVLFNHIHEPINIPKCQEIASTWTIENNLEKYNNITAARHYYGMLKNKWHLPRSVPFSVNEPAHSIEAVTLFNTLYSAKDYETFYNTAVYLRDIVNEGIYVYSLSIAIIYRKDTQGITLPPIYEIFPSYFNNAEVIATAQRINTHGNRFVKYFPSTYVSEDNVVIKASKTAWPYFDSETPISYFTNDYELNAAHYYLSLVTPFWLGEKNTPVIYKQRRGEAWWFAYRQLIARYYLERLSNGLGEIPDLVDFVKEGYTSGLSYHNGIPFPSRPNNFYLTQPEFADSFEKVKEYEQRLWDAIDKGFYINRKGEPVSLLTQSGLEVLGRLVESNTDSPNSYYYKDFIRLWKQILGNTVKSNYQYYNGLFPLVNPSALENYQTALRDPAYYVLLKRILKLFVYWQKQMPLYTPEELAIPVDIKKIEVDKLVTYFENSYLNVTNHLYQTESEYKGVYDDVKVLVQYPRLNHKPFNVKVNVNSESAKKVLVKFFLAPKYDSKGYEIPLKQNTENFFLVDQFVHDLPAGESVVTRKSTDFAYTAPDSVSSYDIYNKVVKGVWTPTRRSMNVFPQRLVLPKGKVGGMTFQFVVYIQEFNGSFGSHGFPTDRTLLPYQIKNVKNLYFQDVVIFHKPVPEVSVPHTF